MPTYPVVSPPAGVPERDPHPLEVFFAPETVAVFGATEAPGSAGRALMTNLIRSPSGATLFPINPKRRSVLGVRAYPGLRDTPRPVELAIVATPAATVPDVLAECAAAGVKGAVVISSGFRGCGSDGAELERRLAEQLRPRALRVLGPNCFGVACPRTGLNATFAPAPARRGGVGLISQSGALLAAFLGDDLPDSVGCSAFISLGDGVDLGWADWLGYLVDDPQTEMIGIYAEALGDPRSFFHAIRQVTARKPVILVKGGRAGTAGPHAGGLAGRDDVLEDLFRRAGVLRVDTVGDLVRTADLLATQPVPHGRRVTIVSNACGPAVLATDDLVAEGGALAPLAPKTATALEALLPPRCRLRNPVDVGDDADAERYARAAALAGRDPNTDALLLILTPHATVDPLRAAEAVSRLTDARDKPILACWMWGAASPGCLAVLNRAGIPTFPGPDVALRALGYLWRHGENLQGLSEGAAGDVGVPAPGHGLAGTVVEAARQAGRTLLTDAEARQLLESYSLPAAGTRVAVSAAQAIEWAAALGYPVALGPLLEAEGLPGGSDGLRLSAGDEDAVRWAYRTLKVLARARKFKGVLIQPAVPADGCAFRLRSVTDPQFGPVLRLGAGGPWAAAPADEAIAVPPLTTAQVRQLFAQTPFGPLLQDLADNGLDVEALEQFLVRFSRLVAEQRWVSEISIDPLLVSRERLLALDPRVTVHGSDVREEHLPGLILRSHPAQGAIPEEPKPPPPAAPRLAEGTWQDEPEAADAALGQWRFLD
jgi:acetyltransferase